MIDDGVPGDSVPDEPDRAVVWGDEQPVIPNSGGPPPSEPVGDPGEVTAGESLASDTTSSPLVALTRDIWGETTSGGGTTDLELGAEAPSYDDWWLPGEDGNALLEEPLVAGPLPDANVAGFAADVPPTARPAVRPGPRRPALAPAAVTAGRGSAVRRSFGAVQVNTRVAAMALLVIAVVAGLSVALAARGPDEPPAGALRQIDAAGVRPTSTVPPSTIPPEPSPAVTTRPAPDQPAPAAPGNAPATSPASPSPAGTTPITTSATRAPDRPATTVASAQPPARPPAPPAPTPAPTPTATMAPPTTTAVTLPPASPADPETTATTRRPRPTVPETTLPVTTVPTSTSLPADPGN